MCRVVALTYNWWTPFAGIANAGKQIEAVTSRPLEL